LETAEYDLIVAGAGPAGSACAITAARAGARVLLLEKDRLPRHKVCGEFVSPESLELLARLVGENKFKAKPAIGNARIFSGAKVISLPISPSARSIPRFELDAALLDAARSAGAHAQEGVTIAEVQRDRNFKVVSSAGTFGARAVVNATGRWSQLTQHISKDKNRWIGIKGHFNEASPSLSVDLYFFDGGYCGVQPVSDEAVNACAMVRANAARSLEEVFSCHPELWRRSRDWTPLFPPITTSPLYFREPKIESNGMLMAGDSAAFIDPFAGDGISLALHSGALGAESVVPFLQGACSLAQAQERYAVSYGKQFAPAFRNAARVRMMLNAPPVIRSSLLRLAGIGPFARAIVRSTRIRHKKLVTA
jgi:menaquinone-9 beta-reductase